MGFGISGIGLYFGSLLLVNGLIFFFNVFICFNVRYMMLLVGILGY